MKIVTFASLGAVLIGTCAYAVAFAAEPATTVSDCHDMAKQVKTALAEHAQAGNYRQAVAQQTYGQQFCERGFDHDGVVHYTRALELLQTNKS
jgi:hypothetical protein